MTMGKVIFKPNQPVQGLSGTYAGAEFRTMKGGGTVVYARTVENLIDDCVASIQARMGDMRDAIRQRQAIKKRVRRFYDQLKNTTTDEPQLKKYILQAWYNSRRKLPSRAKTATFIEGMSVSNQE